MMLKGRSMMSCVERLRVVSIALLVSMTLLLGGLSSAAVGADEVAPTVAMDLTDDDHDVVGHVDPAHPDPGHGDEAGTPPLLQFDFGSAICNLAIFLGVLAILSKFVWPVILGGLKAREDKIHGELEMAAKANADAKKILADYQIKIDEASTKVQTMLAEARKDSEASGAKIIEEAKAEADRQRVRAVADIETAKKVALADLAGQTSDMAINVAKAVVGRELNASDHADLIRQSLERLPSHN